MRDVPDGDSFDDFLSPYSGDKPWVRSLRDELVRLGLTVWLDEAELPEQDNFVQGLGAAGLRRCRFLVLVLTPQSLSRPWVTWEWTTFMALSGPLGRVIPMLLKEVPLPPELAAVQAIRAVGHSAAEVAEMVMRRIRRHEEMPVDDPRRQAVGQVLAFDLRRDGDTLAVVGPRGASCSVPSPLADTGFIAHQGAFRCLVRTPLMSDAECADLVRSATAVGQALFGVLRAGAGGEWPIEARQAGAQPVLTLCGDVDLLKLPWELVHDGNAFLVRDGVLDLVRTTRDEVHQRCLLREPAAPFTLVVNVSAPAGSALHYETESYRLTLALTEHCPMTPTELGTLDDLIATVQRVGPVGVHFSGHGGPGELQFEDDDGGPARVPVRELVDRLRRELRGDWPSFFYLACCHGNDGGEGAESAAVVLHREGVAQVVGYSGPIADELSTRAEEALYAALAAGQTTRQAMREARAALLRLLEAAGEMHRAAVSEGGAGSYPFAWSQLVLYHRGPDWPLGTPTTAAQLRQAGQALRRTFEGLGQRRVLRSGFIGRRRELHRVRRHLLREGKRVLVLQGLGGLGKSTLAFHVPALLRAAKDEVCILWCDGVQRERDPVEALVGQLLAYCRKRFGPGWEEVVQQVDRAAGDDAVERLAAFLGVLLENVPRLVLILDNLESLLIGPEETASDRPDERALGAWRSEELRRLWLLLREMAEGGERLWLLATCRYQNEDFLDVLLPVTPLPPDALFRLTGWFEALQTLSAATRSRLVARLDGHPRAVEYAEDLVKSRLGLLRRQGASGAAWKGNADREWAEVVEQVLPAVRDRLWANLLLGAIWDNVLDERQRRMLWRMTLLRRPSAWGLMAHLGEVDEDAASAEATTDALCRTSLLEQAEGPEGESTHYTLHPATAAYVRLRQADDEDLRRQTHARVGAFLERVAKMSRWVETKLEGGYHLFEADEYDRAYELLGPASEWLQDRGRVREGLRVLEPFLSDPVQERMQRALVGRLLGTVGIAYSYLGQPQRAIDFYQQHLAIAREVGDRRGEGQTLGNLGVAYAALGQRQQAIDFYQQRLTIAREMGDRGGEAHACWNLGGELVKLDRLAEAIPLMEVRVRFEKEIGHPDAQKCADLLAQLRQFLAGQTPDESR